MPENKKKESAMHPLTATFLGGLEEVGMNCLLLSWQDNHLLIDCGLGFPDPSYYPGVEAAHPCFERLEHLEGEIVGIVVTHGHEDHIGAIPQLLKYCDAPVYGPEFAMKLLGHRLHRHHLQTPIHTTQPDDIYPIGPFEVEWIPVAHSVPHSCCLSIRTPLHHIIHSGDFKFEMPPSPRSPNPLPRLGALGEEGVDLLFCESTNVSVPGFAGSESSLYSGFEDVFLRAKGRIFVVTFSSHIDRLHLAIELAREFGRKIVLLGASLQRNVHAARELGLLQLRADDIIDLNDMHTISPRRLLILATGSQAEPFSAMTRIAMGNHKVSLQQEDSIIWSSRKIPGNENAIGYIHDQIVEQGARLYHSPQYPVHVSGHGFREEIQMMHQLTQPTHLVPIHGRQTFLHEHKLLATQSGFPAENIHLCQNGDRLSLHKGEVTRLPSWEHRTVFMANNSTHPLSEDAQRERRQMSRYGLIVLSAQLNMQGQLSTPPQFSLMGVPVPKENAKDWGEMLQERFEESPMEYKLSKADIEETLRRLLGNHLRSAYRIKPRIEVLLHQT